METADLSEHGTQRLEMKGGWGGGQQMPGSRVLKKPTYLNIYEKSRQQHYSLSDIVPQLLTKGKFPFPLWLVVSC